MLQATVNFIIGLDGSVIHSAVLHLDSAIVGGVSGPFGTRHLLQLGRHFDHYYDRRRVLPIWQTRGIYSRLPNFSGELKAHSNDVSAQIGECCAALIMRRILGLSTSEIEPLVVDSNRKTPDFRIHLNPARHWLGLVVPHNFQIPSEWPVEGKSRPKDQIPNQAFFEALQQIATYWLLRSPQEPSVVGYGMITVVLNDFRNINGPCDPSDKSV